MVGCSTELLRGDQICVNNGVSSDDWRTKTSRSPMPGMVILIIT
jgi:hypothetical protein